MRFDEILASYVANKATDEKSQVDDNVVQNDSEPELSGFEQILYPGRDLETLTDSELDELEATDFGISVLVPENELDELVFSDGDEYLLERIIKKKVVRNGKRMIKFATDKPGFRISKVGGRVKEVKMKATEVRRRERGQKVGARKRKGKSSQAQRKRKMSIKKRL